MANREKKIVSLLEEGFSYDTIKKMSDTHINMLYNRLVKEAVIRVDAEDFGKIKDKVDDNKDTIEVTRQMEEEIDSSNALGKLAMQTDTGQEMPHDVDDMAPDGMDDDSDNNRKMMANEEFFGDINEDEVLEALFGKPKKEMKTPITTLGMFEGKKEKSNPWAVCTSSLGLEGKEREDYTKDESKKFERCVKDVKKQEQKEEKIRQIEESIVSLIKKSQGKVITKKDILSEEPKIAPAQPKVDPGTKPERLTPYRPKPGGNPKPKAGTEVKPAEPKVDPGTKPERLTPYRPKPGGNPKPKAGDEGRLPEFLKFNNLNIKFRDE